MFNPIDSLLFRLFAWPIWLLKGKKNTFNEEFHNSQDAIIGLFVFIFIIFAIMVININFF